MKIERQGQHFWATFDSR